MQVRRTVYFSGHVQGVGFRYTTEDIARAFEVTGRVRNLADGRVELVAEGTPEELDRFIAAIARRMERYLSGMSAGDAPAGESFDDFRIGG